MCGRMVPHDFVKLPTAAECIRVDRISILGGLLTSGALDWPTLATFLNRILLYDVQRTQRLVMHSRTQFNQRILGGGHPCPDEARPVDGWTPYLKVHHLF
jgi:hypothetical protein